VFKLTNNRSPAESLRGIRNKPEYERLETRGFIQCHGIARYQMNPYFPVNTLMMMRGAIAAQSLGVFERYVDEMFRDMWAEPKKMDDLQVWRTALSESGLPTERIVELIETRRSKSNCSPIHSDRSSVAPSARQLSMWAMKSSLARIGCETSKK